MKPGTISGLVGGEAAVSHRRRHRRPLPFSKTHQEHTMKKMALSALVVVAASTFAPAALAQDVAAGKTSFNKCPACHAIREGAKNRGGPELNGIDGRKSGNATDYTYSNA